VIPADSVNVTAVGQKVTGVWGNVGGFVGSNDLSTWTATFSAPSFGVEGTVTLSSNAQHHFGCNTTTDPYFSSVVPAGATLSDAENLLFTQVGWATSIPGKVILQFVVHSAVSNNPSPTGGQSVVDLTIGGSKLQFTGQGYHDANWSPQPINSAVESWFFGSATIGEYDLSYISITPSNSTKILTTGYLSRNGVVLQNQCSLQGTKANDHSVITPYGLQHDSVANVQVPQGFIIEYILANGDRYSFNLTSSDGVQNPDQIVYHRWVCTGTGGRVGGRQSSGLTVFEWLNPGEVVYSPTA
jgi:hypothetical protein